MASNTGRAGQQGKGTDSCPEMVKVYKAAATSNAYWFLY